MASRRGRSAKAESAEPEEIDVDDPGFGVQDLQFIDIKEELFEELGSDSVVTKKRATAFKEGIVEAFIAQP